MPLQNEKPISHRHKGHVIESLAEQWLSKQGLTLAERNFTLRGGEIDLIMWEGSTLIFIEVRYRMNDKHGSGAESITYAKRRKIMRTAEFYLQKHFGNKPPFCRIDVVAGSGEPITFEWIKNAFA